MRAIGRERGEEKQRGDGQERAHVRSVGAQGGSVNGGARFLTGSRRCLSAGCRPRVWLSNVPSRIAACGGFSQVRIGFEWKQQKNRSSRSCRRFQTTPHWKISNI